MSLPHFFIEGPLDCTQGENLSLTIDAPLMQHLCTLRLQAGEGLVLVDAPGHAWELQLSTTPDKRAKRVQGTVVRELFSTRESDLTLIQGISAADRMDQTIRQVTELGVSCVIPLESERCTVRLDERRGADKRSRWQRIAQSAAEQSCQLWRPVIEKPTSLDRLADRLEGFDLILLFWEEPEGHALGKAFAAFADTAATTPLPLKVALLIGPEGGFSQDEVTRIRSHGAQTITMGSTILRTETAAVVACALVLYHLGALGARA